MRREDMAPIEVYCDDPRHARGKVAEMGTFMVIGTGRFSQWMFMGSRFDPIKPGMRLDVLNPGGAEASTLPRCKLCGRRPGLSFDRLQELCDGLGRLGITRVSLSLLDG